MFYFSTSLVLQKVLHVTPICTTRYIFFFYFFSFYFSDTACRRMGSDIPPEVPYKHVDFDSRKAGDPYPPFLLKSIFLPRKFFAYFLFSFWLSTKKITQRTCIYKSAAKVRQILQTKSAKCRKAKDELF